MPSFQRLLRNFGSIAFVLVLLIAVAYLPPDTSLSEVRATATLKVCVPPVYPPLVTGNPERPGIDIEILRAITRRMDVSLVLSQNQAMGRDFNPRNWALSRAQCQVIAGGVVNSDQTRSFLETGPAYAETGWAFISPTPLASLEGLNVGTLSLVSGLDRIGLASFLRAEGAKTRVMGNRDALVAGLSSGMLDAGVTESMLAASLAAENSWAFAWAPPGLARYDLVFGLWKGDVTLKRAIESAFTEIAADGTLTAIFNRYGVEPLS